MQIGIAFVAALIALLAAGCGGGTEDSPVGTDQTAAICTGSCAAASSQLSVADVQRILSQGIAEARARNASATIAVVDRVGNVLAVYRMGAAAVRRVTIATGLDAAGRPRIRGGLEGISLPSAPAPLNALNIDHQAAIAKAVTGAYLSSEGNAFSSRTASQIVQQNFNVGEQFQPSGPLFGVQFSQLACSDFMQRSTGTTTAVGPQRSPLGLSADPGGFPLYKDGTVVGGVGAIADGAYGIDADITDRDASLDEAVAYAATFGFAAPVDRRADRITADGKTLRFSDLEFADLASTPSGAPALATLPAGTGALVPVPGYTDGTIRAGTVFGQSASGIRPDAGVDYPGLDAFVFVDAANAPRFAPRAGTEASGGITAAETRQLLRSALAIANRTRAQIRRPVGSEARVTIAIVDSQGTVLGVARTRDAPVFGADVSLQKARSAAFLSSASAATYLAALPPARYLTASDLGLAIDSVDIGGYVVAARRFFADPALLGDGRIAFSDRALGNVARPFFPDGLDGSGPGPFSKPTGQWSPFSTGLQLDLSINAVLQHVLFVAGALPTDVAPGCSGVSLATDLSSVSRVNADFRLGNGLQIFPGSMPIYRGSTLVGAIGVSGDGVDQDDMVAFLGLQDASTRLNGALGQAPADRRADTLAPEGVRLKYVQCPQSPFIDSNQDNVCAGL